MSAPPGTTHDDSGAGRRGGGRSLRRWTLDSLRTLGILVSLALLFGYFSIAIEEFNDWNNLQNMARQMVIVSLAAIGMTLVIISKGIDLSVGSVIALSMVVTGWSIEQGVPHALAAALGLAAGVVCGAVNGAVITGFRLAPFIATLGMMGIARGAAKLLAKSQAINVPTEGWSESWLRLLMVNPRVPGAEPLPGLVLGPGATTLPAWMLVAPSVWLLVLLVVGMSAVMRWSVFGRHVFAIGSNEAAARLCGVAVERSKLMIYTLCGAFSGLAGVVFCSRQAQGDPTAAVGLELDVIAAVVIGGGSLNGGAGSIAGSIAGAAIMIVLRTGLRMMVVPSPVQEILIGVIIILAVVLDQLQHARRE